MPKDQQLSGSKYFRRASRRQRLIGAWVLVLCAPILTFCVLGAWDLVDVATLMGPCGFKIQHNLPCPTCGITTSLLAFFRGQLLRSFYLQPAGGVIGSLLVLSVFLAFLTTVFGVYFGFVERFFAQVKIRHIVLAVIIVIVAGWMVTLARAVAAYKL